MNRGYGRRANLSGDLAGDPAIGNGEPLGQVFGNRSQSERVAQVIDAGNIQSMTQDELMAESSFFMASVGFDSVVVEHVHRRRRGHINRWTLCMADHEDNRHLFLSQIDIHCCKKVDQASCYSSSTYPNTPVGSTIAPWANGQDGLLDVCTFREVE